MRLASIVGVLFGAILISGSARAETAGIVVDGEPNLGAEVATAATQWLQARGVSISAIDPVIARSLADCAGTDVSTCAPPLVRSAAVDRLVLLQVLLDKVGKEGTRSVVLEGWLFARDGHPLAGDRRYCERCRSLTETTASLLVELDHAAAAQGKPGVLRVRTTPPGANVLVDGEPVGPTPLRYMVRPGPHSVTIDLAGHEVEVMSISVAEGDTEDIDVPLRRKPASGGAGPWPYVAVGAGTAALAAGTVLIAIHDPRPDRGERGRTYRESLGVGIGVAAVGAVGVGLGVYLLLRESPKTGLTAAVGSDSMMIGYEGRF